MYAIYHGAAGIRRIASKVHGYTQAFKSIIESFGYQVENTSFFDTLSIDTSLAGPDTVYNAALAASINLRKIDEKRVGVTFDESANPNDLLRLINVFASSAGSSSKVLADLKQPLESAIPPPLQRTSEFLPHPVFNKHHSETEMLRYINHLASKDISLVHSMIPLGSCTMKLNSTSSMIPLTWPEFSNVHPFAPRDQVVGYDTVIKVGFSLFVMFRQSLTKCCFVRNWNRTFARLPGFMLLPSNQIRVQLENTQDSVLFVLTMSHGAKAIATYASSP